METQESAESRVIPSIFSLMQLCNHAADEVRGKESAATLTFAAEPVEESVSAPTMSESDAGEIFDSVDASQFWQNPNGRLRLYPYADYKKYRRGLRRWSLFPPQETPEWRKTVHENGAVTTAHRLGGLGPDLRGKHDHCLSVLVEGVVAHGFAMAAVAAERLGVRGNYLVRVNMVGRFGHPIFIRTLSQDGEDLLPLSDSEPVINFSPITTIFNPLAATGDLLPLIREVCLDIVNQGGVRNLQAMRSEPGLPAEGRRSRLPLPTDTPQPDDN